MGGLFLSIFTPDSQQIILALRLAIIGFLVIGLGATLVSIFIHWLEANKWLPDICIEVMGLLEYYLFGADVLWFAFYVFVELANTLRETASLWGQH
jgi:hypothetical protein